MGDVEFWNPSYPDWNDIIHPVNAVQIIHDLVMQVSHSSQIQYLIIIRNHQDKKKHS